MAIRLVLADDHPVVLEGLAALFRREPDIKVLARCLNGEEALQAVREHRPDLLVLDIRMPKMDGLGVLRQMKKESLSSRVVLLTMGLDEDQVVEGLRLGVSGLLLKEMASHLLVHCVRKVHAGEQWLETRSFARVMDKLLRREAGVREITEVLTPREVGVVRLVAAGLSNREIGEKLFISQGTVKNHLRNIFEKLKVSDRAELTRYARDKLLID